MLTTTNSKKNTERKSNMVTTNLLIADGLHGKNKTITDVERQYKKIKKCLTRIYSCYTFLI